MSNPFLPWLPMYAPGSVPERPWWRENEAFEHVRIGGGPFVRGGIVYAGVVVCAGGALLETLTRLDAEHPLPAPPPMAGQVWCDRGPGGEAVQFTIHAVIGGQPVVVVDDTGPTPVAWPPAGAVLVAGPTPWGRDVPWAPAGWKS